MLLVRLALLIVVCVKTGAVRVTNVMRTSQPYSEPFDLGLSFQALEPSLAAELETLVPSILQGHGISVSCKTESTRGNGAKLSISLLDTGDLQSLLPDAKGDELSSASFEQLELLMGRAEVSSVFPAVETAISQQVRLAFARKLSTLLGPELSSRSGGPVTVSNSLLETEAANTLPSLPDGRQLVLWIDVENRGKAGAWTGGVAGAVANILTENGFLKALKSSLLSKVPEELKAIAGDLQISLSTASDLDLQTLSYHSGIFLLGAITNDEMQRQLATKASPEVASAYSELMSAFSHMYSLGLDVTGAIDALQTALDVKVLGDVRGTLGRVLAEKLGATVRELNRADYMELRQFSEDAAGSCCKTNFENEEEFFWVISEAQTAFGCPRILEGGDCSVQSVRFDSYGEDLLRSRSVHAMRCFPGNELPEVDFRKWRPNVAKLVTHFCL